MAFLWYALLAAGIVAADQVSKYLVVKWIPLYQQRPFLGGILGLTHVHNDGAAFSAFPGMQWLFALIFVAFTGMLLYEYFKKPMGFTRFERWCLAAIYGGGLGNMVDRLRFGYVVDMLETKFISFPIFNVADCFITCGCILLVIHMALFNRQFWEEKKA